MSLIICHIGPEPTTDRFFVVVIVSLVVTLGAESKFIRNRPSHLLLKLLDIDFVASYRYLKEGKVALFIPLVSF